jgi:hypothetical protein
VTFDPLDPRAAPIVVGERLLDSQKHILVVQSLAHDPSFGGETITALDTSVLGTEEVRFSVQHALDQLYSRQWQYAGPPRLFSRRGNKTPPPGAVYIGRPSKWGNPFNSPLDRAWNIRQYAVWLPAQTELVAAAKLELRGRDLVCWCAPNPCHGHILMQVANER